MMKSFLTSLAGLLFAVAAHAAPSLTGSLITSVNTDKARYLPGEIAHVQITLHNTTGSTYSGSVIATMSGRGVTVAMAKYAVSTLANTGTTTLDLTLPIPQGEDFRGFFVQIQAQNGSGSTLDSAAAAIDLSSDWAVYPRECFVTNLSAGANTANLEAGLRAWHCNILQFYDANYKHHLPYAAGSTWPNLANVTISRDTIEAYIAAAHAGRMAAFYYTLWNGAYPNYLTDGTSVQTAWGMFATNCSPNCALANMAGTPSNGGSGGLFPSNWAATWLAEMDPTNAGWITYWETVNAPVLRGLGYDGLQIDTLGNPGTVYNSTGGTINLSTALTGFVNSVRTTLNARGVINNVSRWSEADVARNATQDFYYTELHPEFNDTPFYPSLNSATATIRGYAPAKGINFAIYMDGTYSNTNTCQSGGGQNVCYFNLPGLLYTDASVMAAGAYHVYLADGDRFVSNIYIPGPQLSMSAASIQAEYDYQTFGVAYEKLLRSAVYDAQQTASVTGGFTGGTTGAAGQIYILPKTRPGLQILHLLNFTQATTNQIQDQNANTAAPTQVTSVGVKMYYSGALTKNGKLWMASPDVNHGAPQQITYNKSSDGTGNYITFTAPSLLYWDMFWLELDSLSSSDYSAP